MACKNQGANCMCLCFPVCGDCLQSGLCGCLAWSRCAAAILGVCLYIRNSCRKMAVVYQQQCQLDKIQGMVENLEHLMQPHTPIAQSSPDSSPSFWKIQNYCKPELYSTKTVAQPAFMLHMQVAWVVIDIAGIACVYITQ